jgi:AAA+ ATPase superfamily predicted ATPase
MGNRKLSDIATSMGVKQTSLTKYLKTLIDLDLIEREVPVTESSPEKSKRGNYRITDNFIAFWFKFVYPYRSLLERGEEQYVMSQIRKGFVQNYVSYVYEDVCREKMWEYAGAGMWDFLFDRLGRYWGAVTGETDILAIDTVGRHLIVGECKYTAKEKGKPVFIELEKKAKALADYMGIDDVRYVIFSTAGFTKGLTSIAEKNPQLKLIEKL